MDPMKLILLIALELILEGYCQVIQVPQTCTCVTSSPVITPGTFVIPAIIKPIIQPDISVPAPAPIVPPSSDFSSYGLFPPGPPPFPGPFGGFPSYPGPYGGMPPIIIDDDDDDRGFNWIYWLILALSRRCGGGYGGYGGYGGGYGYGGGNNGGCCNCGGNYGGGGCNGFNFNGFGGNGYGIGGNGFGNSNSCGNYIYIPYPVPVPCGGSIGGGFGPFDYSYEESPVANPAANEINLIIRTDQCPPPPPKHD